ncbi:MAG: SUMF1/EgtB/PvdO family nonheme iron enzyme [Planctomycetes bacterium]|jgi:iron(II)-dependent oxidoreductase|nr:SUMF1/EgtB/PvdO family nonheme iron enzyme [Planctomycetota bacterium]MBT4559538.1 SUMF1/EgtB/PvdO family nonheme iron enzyme [Planctomycetota bacterium]
MLTTSLLLLAFSGVLPLGACPCAAFHPSLALDAAPVCFPIQEAQERKEKRARKRLTEATQKRDEAYLALSELYSACEAWLTAEEILNPPAPLLAWLESEGFGTSKTAEQRAHVLQAGEFHILWNTAIYRLSDEAKQYQRTVNTLERAFLALEKLRHPARFERGFTETPPGMVLIPGDRYELGPGTGWVLTHPKWAAAHTERIRSFYIDKNEVTCGEYQQFLLAQPASMRLQHLPLKWQLSQEDQPIYPPGSGSFAVRGVSWVSASRFAEWAGKRLPTELEWEAAAAGLEKRRYPLGKSFSAAKINCRAFGLDGPGSSTDFPEDRTPLGIACMSGNVREWTADLYEEPTTGTGRAKEARTAEAYTMAIVRGGSFLDKPNQCASTYRWTYPALDSRLAHVGFRCALRAR